ncbi:MAG: histidine kinase dimerization/phosphoacceptor domain -containing protein, partial [Bacteroidota bacterium]
RQTTHQYDLFLENQRALVLRRYTSSSKAMEVLQAAEANAAIDTPLPYLAAATKILGTLAQDLDDYPVALDYLQRSLSHYTALKDSEEMALVLNSIAEIHKQQRNFPLASEYSTRAKDTYDKTGLSVLKGTIANNLAGVYTKTKEYELALYYYDEAIRIAQEQTPRRWNLEASAQANKGNIYRAQEDYAKGLAAYEAAIPIVGQYSGRKSQLATLLGKGRCLLGLERYHEAKAIFYSILTKGGGEYGAINRAVSRALFLTYTSLGKVDSAKHYAQQYLDLQLAAQEKNSAVALAEMEARYASAEQQKEIERLEQGEERNKDRIRRLWQYLIIGGIVLLIIGWLAYRNFLQRRRIQKQNEVISAAIGEKETLMREIHHRVKNNLQMVSSLLTLQSDYVSDNVALDALASGKSRVRSMALIHQNLYLDDTAATTVNAREYLEKLVHEVIESLRLPGQQISRVIDVTEVDFDIDLMIPLGLITNELITNSMKYAFQGREKGKLRLSLQPNGRQYRLAVSDDGPGFSLEDDATETSFGHHLLQTLSDQLDAKVSIQSGRDGTLYTLEFAANQL